MKIPNFRSAKLVQVIKVECGEGEGTTESPYRVVTHYVDPVSGAILVSYDPIHAITGK